MLGKLIRGLRGRSETPKPPSAALTKPVEAAAPTVAEPTPTAAPSPFELPGLPFMIRPLEPNDLPQLADIFSNAIETLAARDYDTVQRSAWTAKKDQPEFLEMLQQGVTIVAENHHRAVAFAQLHPSTHLRMLYVHPEWASLGIATLMYQYLEDEARILGADHLDTHASHTAKRFFESVGFKLQEQQSITLDGVAIERNLMEKKLTR